jgi:signal transduction histidine kinase
VRSQASSQADVVAATAADLLASHQRPGLERLAQTAARTVHGRVIVVDAGGRVLADSAGAATLGVSYASRPEVRAALVGRSAQFSRGSHTLGQRLLATAVPVVRGGRSVGAVRVTQSVAAVDAAVRHSIAGLVLIAALVIALGLIAGALIAARVSRPLRALQGVAGRVAAGDLGARAEIEGTAEQRSLALSFNEMTARLGRALRGQRAFVADASHQLRTPLTALRLRLEEARAAELSPAARHEIDAGLAEVDRLALMVDELLVLSDAGERDAPAEELELSDGARRAVARWDATARECGLDLALHCNGRSHVRCATVDLDRALDSLLENAVRYAPGPGEVSVRVHDHAIDVLDRGPGLRPGEEEDVFERFHRGSAGRAAADGTGLGLPIARELARRWGGDVTLRNRDGGGACARLRFPAAKETP